MLKYYKGLLVSNSYFPGSKLDNKLRQYVALAYKYREALEYFRSSNVEVEDKVLNPLPFPIIRDSIKLRDYQQRALEAWLKEKRGVIVLPTGAGKTLIALKAISILKVSSLIVVPTIDLLKQWHEAILEKLGFDAGIIGGGEDSLKGITVITYDSAYTRAEALGNLFQFLIFDEVHHLPSEGYMQISQLFAAPYRLGLTATPERSDGREILLPDLVGPIVYRISPNELAGKYLSKYVIQRIYVSLTEEEKELYTLHREKLKRILGELNLKLRSLEDFHNLLRLAYKDRRAREAILAWHESLRIAVNSRSKVEKLRELLEKYRDEKILIFTRNIEMAYEISRTFLIPAVTYRTPKDEREEILKAFKDGKYKVIVTSNVFDEGVDIPDASIAIILGGYGTSRQFIQRLGRILRPKGDRVAKLIEIVTKGTADYSLSRRRRSNVTV
ncbi:MAG: DEAD/DEAH box helicase family protein [Ignisphaera sp.]